MGIIKYSRFYCSKMVTKTDQCSFTQYKIVPGRGTRFISKDGRTHYFISTKARSLYHQKIKPVKLTWNMAWRAHNKKIKVDDIQKKRSRKTTRIQKAESREDRDKNADAAAKEIKDRKAKQMQQKKAQASKNQKGGAKAADKAINKNVKPAKGGRK